MYPKIKIPVQNIKIHPRISRATLNFSQVDFEHIIAHKNDDIVMKNLFFMQASCIYWTYSMKICL
jgi:hypothetical protein